MNFEYKCNICSSIDYTVISHKLRDDYNNLVLECKNCKHIQLFNKYSDKKNKKFYDLNEQSLYVEKKINLNRIENKLKVDNTRRANFIDSMYEKNINILDLGYGYGFF